MATTNGLLLPKGYQLSKSVSNRPWICPIRTCRLMFIKKNELGYHFLVCFVSPMRSLLLLLKFPQRAHFGTRLNDNGDGTFSILGVYQTQQISAAGTPQNKSPPIVVSQDTSVTTGLADGGETEQALRAEPQGNKDANASGPNRVWDLVSSYVIPDQPPSGAYVQELLHLPQKRELGFNLSRSGGCKFEEKTHRDIAAMIIQLTGDSPPLECTRCRDNKGIFDKCIVISTQAFPDARSRYISCASCLYHGNQTYCNLKEWVVIRPQSPFPRQNRPAGWALSEGQRQKEDESSTTTDLTQTPGEAVAKSVETSMPPYNAPNQPASLLSSSNAEGSATPREKDHSTENWRPGIRDPPVQSRALPFQQQAPYPETRSASTAPTARITRSAQHRSSSHISQPPRTNSSSLISIGTVQPMEILEMETWEVAPGRIREGSTTNPESGFRPQPSICIGRTDDEADIAFSKAYLSTNQVVPVCEDVSFRVDTIHSGGTLQIKSGDSETRICSVATGKVRVRTGSEPEFTIGPHGMFKIKPGVECTVQNWMYMDAIIHITALSGFG